MKYRWIKSNLPDTWVYYSEHYKATLDLSEFPGWYICDYTGIWIEGLFDELVTKEFIENRVKELELNYVQEQD